MVLEESLVEVRMAERSLFANLVHKQRALHGCGNVEEEMLAKERPVEVNGVNNRRRSY